MIGQEGTVLLVDNSPTSRNQLALLLEDLGCRRVESASNGQEALNKINESDGIALVIAEWRLPKIDGLKLLRLLRTDPRWNSLPFVIVTTKADAESVALAVDLDVTHYLVKPVTREALRSKLQGLDTEGPNTAFKAAVAMARVSQENGDPDKAEESLRDAADQYPVLLPRVLYELARFRLDLNRVREALSLLDQALEAAPRMTRGWVLRAEILDRSGRLIEAEESLERALAISPDNPFTLVSLGRLQLRQSQVDQAKWSFMRAVNASDRDEQVLLAIFQAYSDLGYTDSGLKEFSPYLLAHLGCDALNNLGVTLRKQGRIKPAIETYRQAILRFPGSAQLHYNLAVAHLSEGSAGQAIQSLERCLHLDPGFSKAATLLKELKA